MTMRQLMWRHSCPEGRAYARRHGYNLRTMLAPEHTVTYLDNPVGFCAMFVLGKHVGERLPTSLDRVLTPGQIDAIVAQYVSHGITQLDGGPSWRARLAAWGKSKSSRWRDEWHRLAATAASLF